MTELLWDVAQPARTALIVVDVQNDFCHEEGTHGSRGADMSQAQSMVRVVERLRDRALSSGVLVILVRTEHSAATDTPSWQVRGGSRPLKSNSVRTGSWGAQWYGLHPRPSEQVMTKHRYSAFYNTDLDGRLRTAGITTVVVTGIVAGGCVESTARDACMRDYYVVFPSDAVASHTERDRQAALRSVGSAFGIVTTTSEVERIWSAAGGNATAAL